MDHFLRKKLGEPRRLHSKHDAVGKRGILLFSGVRSLHGGGKVDLWDGTQTGGVEDYFPESDHIALWIMD